MMLTVLIILNMIFITILVLALLKSEADLKELEAVNERLNRMLAGEGD